MNVFQPVLQSCPWMPQIGNHEHAIPKVQGYDSSRFEAMAEGLVIGEESISFLSSADTAVGHHLSLGTLLGAGLQGKVPSGTSRYASVDVGQIHVVAIETQFWDDRQREWL